ncbi:MAG: glycosyltransferase family 1 protein [Nitrospina sp.]|nr:MAG: glycosyltransferase family 1 protein [Nitrospina sp.]
MVASTLEYEDAVEFGIAKEKIHVIPYGIEVPHQSKIETDRASGPFHILFAGDINRTHRIELILRAARKLTVPFQITLVDRDDRPDHEKPRILQELRKLCQTLGIEDRVEFAERKSPDAMNALYQKADVLVHPAIYENFGMPMLEAAAAGLPLIATPVGVALELVTSGETGFIVPADPDTICDRLLQLSEPKTRAEFSQNLRQRARQLFGWNNVMERYLELYRQLAPGGNW